MNTDDNTTSITTLDEAKVPKMKLRSQSKSKIKDELNTLQQKYSEVVQEKDFYKATKIILYEEITRIQTDNDKLLMQNQELNVKNQLLEDEIDSARFDLHNTNFEMNVLEVDYHNEIETNSQLNAQIREQRRQIKALQQDISEADRTNTKRNHRLISSLEELTEENKKQKTQIGIIESDLDKVDMLCHICKGGVKTIKCEHCNNKLCAACNNNLAVCPFCRNILS